MNDFSNKDIAQAYVTAYSNATGVPTTLKTHPAASAIARCRTHLCRHWTTHGTMRTANIPGVGYEIRNDLEVYFTHGQEALEAHLVHEFGARGLIGSNLQKTHATSRTHALIRPAPLYKDNN